jgi:hypothetical protein
MSIDKQELVRRVSQRVERETGTIELLELDKSGIHVAEYLTVLPSKELSRLSYKNRSPLLVADYKVDRPLVREVSSSI